MNTILLGFEPQVLSEQQLAWVQALAPNMKLLLTTQRSEIEDALDEIEIAVRRFPRDLLRRASSLRWFQQWGAGADWLMRHPEAKELDFILTNVSGIHAIPISEHILAMLLSFARALHQAAYAQQRQEWLAEPENLFELAGQTMLLIGVGAIGQRTAKLANALGMRVLGVRRNPSINAPGVKAMYSLESLPQLLPKADAVVLTVPLTHETKGIIGSRELRAMKPSAVLINIGRGSTVVEDELIHALQKGWLAGAGLDVFESEPLAKTSALWAMDNVIISSHYSGSTPKYNERALDIFLDNLRRYRASEALRNVVDKTLGY